MGFYKLLRGKMILRQADGSKKVFSPGDVIESELDLLVHNAPGSQKVIQIAAPVAPAGATSFDDEDSVDGVDLHALSKAKLVEFAAQHNIAIAHDDTKAEMIARIEEGLAVD